MVGIYTCTCTILCGYLFSFACTDFELADSEKLRMQANYIMPAVVYQDALCTSWYKPMHGAKLDDIA